MENKEDIYIEKEKKGINGEAWCITIFVLINGLLSCLWNSKGMLGVNKLYFGALLPIGSIIVTIIYIVLYIRHLRKVKEYRFRYAIIGILILFLCVMHVCMSTNYVKDLIGGTKMLVSEEYSIAKGGVLRCFVEGEEYGDNVYIYITKEQKKYIEEYLENDENKVIQISEHISVMGSKYTAEVEYYPNSGVLKEINFKR